MCSTQTSQTCSSQFRQTAICEQTWAVQAALSQARPAGFSCFCVLPYSVTQGFSHFKIFITQFVMLRNQRTALSFIFIARAKYRSFYSNLGWWSWFSSRYNKRIFKGQSLIFMLGKIYHADNPFDLLAFRNNFLNDIVVVYKILNQANPTSAICKMLK